MDSKNIIDIHNTIIKTFQNEENLIPIIEERIEELKYFYDNKLLSDRLEEKVGIEIQDLEKKYHTIKSKENLYFYILQSTIVLEEYKNELNKSIEVNFMGEKVNVDTTKIDQIYLKFIKLVQKFHPIEYTPVIVDNDVCSTCKNVSNDNIIESTNTIVCSLCGTEKDILQLTFSYNDTDRINITSKYTYDRRVHFRECINQFQGKQNSTIKQKVYDELIEQLELHGLVREGDLPQKIKYEKVQKYHISIFLKEIDYENHYEDLNLIYHTITGNELADISHLEDILMDDFDKLSQIYNEEYIKKKKIPRKNFINTQYVLYQLLKRHKYPCSKHEFSFLKTIERKQFHDDICSDLFMKLGWNFTCCF